MPLSEKARIEVYLPDVLDVAYQDLVEALRREFSFSFGGATVLHGLDGSYLSRSGQIVTDRIYLIFTDTPFSLEASFEKVVRYADRLHDAMGAALREEAILVVVQRVYHREP